MIGDVFRLKVACVKSFRVGKKMPGKDRLLIVSLESVSIRQELLRMAPQLRSSNMYSGIYINPDLTLKEREQGRKLREELATRKQSGEKNLTIRKGRIVSLDVPITRPDNHISAPSTESRSGHQQSSDVRQANPGSTPEVSLKETRITTSGQALVGKQ